MEVDSPIRQYMITDLVGDVVGVVNALGADEAMVVGHDWGAPVAWCSALTRPDIFRAVVGLSVPFLPPTGELPDGWTVNDFMRSAAGDEREYYRLFFQEPGEAETDLQFYVDEITRSGFRGGLNWSLLEGAGHWIQQERPAEVNEMLVTFLQGLYSQPFAPQLHHPQHVVRDARYARPMFRHRSRTPRTLRPLSGAQYRSAHTLSETSQTRITADH